MVKIEKTEPIKSICSYKIGTFIVSLVEGRSDSNIIEFFLSEERMAFVYFMFGISKDVIKESGQSFEEIIKNNAPKSIDYYISKFGKDLLKNPFYE
ncbi:MAG: hypothetical protein MJ080_05435 [Clostridia bacterium]|nr:hypothetical protein [Clostridia bacterium]